MELMELIYVLPKLEMCPFSHSLLTVSVAGAMVSFLVQK